MIILRIQPSPARCEYTVYKALLIEISTTFQKITNREFPKTTNKKRAMDKNNYNNNEIYFEIDMDIL